MIVGRQAIMPGSLIGCVAGSIDPEGAQDRSARDALALAQGGLWPLLTLEIASTGRSATNRDGTALADPADEHREPTLGRAAHPRRITQAWV
jgi:hypothetical protein